MDAPRRAFVLGALALSVSPRAHAAANAHALSLYTSGAYLRAADAAAAAGTPDDLVLVCRAVLAQVVVEPRRTDALSLIARATRAAETALARAPASADARVQLAAALGMRGRRVGMATALGENIPMRGRTLVDEAIARAPRNAWAYAMLGGWHLEVVRRGGALGAAAFGASVEDGIAACDRARTLAPQDAMVAIHYGLALLGLQPGRYARRVRGLFDAAAACRARDAFETHLQREAARINAVLVRRGPNPAQALADETFP